MKSYKIQLIRALFIALLSFSKFGMAEPVSQSTSDAARIEMLERALAPNSAKAVVEMFAKANKERNGAVQFMLFSDELKKKFKDNWPSWVSGVSSPWITSYAIKNLTNNKFQITYQWATSQGPFKPFLVQTIKIEPVPKSQAGSQKFWISQFEESSAN